MDPDGVDAHIAHLVDDIEVVGRFELDLDRKPAGLLHRRGALGDVTRTTVDTASATGGQGCVDGTVEIASSHGHLSEHLRGLLDDRATGVERNPDAAESALVGVAPVGAGLNHCGGKGIEVEQRDLLVGDSVGGLEVVIARTLLRLGASEPDSIDVDAVSLVLGAKGVRGVAHVRGGRCDAVALNPQHAEVGGARTTRATLHRGIHPHTTSLDVDGETTDVETATVARDGTAIRIRPLKNRCVVQLCGHVRELRPIPRFTGRPLRRAS
ncbi:unannotated protein [freshwater metagenome]|uniref:Unannotated protein n=1 Tax=freshwater metagenome TaxID=449393 RepID=A0A6J7BV42_9ZZZZ